MKAKVLIPSLEAHCRNLLAEIDILDYDLEGQSLEEMDSDLYNRIKNYLTTGKTDSSTQKVFADELFLAYAGSNWEDSDEDPDLKIKKACSKKIAAFFSEIMPTEKDKSDEKKSKKFGSDSNLAVRILDTVKDDTKTIAIRLGAKQLAKAVQEPMTAMLIQALELDSGSATKNKVVKFLKSEFGLGLISMACSVGLPMLPMPEAAKESLSELVKEMRIQSEMVITEPVVELFSAPVREFMSKQLLALPGIPGFSVPQLMASNIDTKNIEVKEIKTVVKPKAPAKKAAKKKSDPQITVKEIKNKEARA